MADLFAKIRRKLINVQNSIRHPISFEDGVLIQQIQAARLTYLSRSKLVNIVRVIRLIEAVGYQGVFIEAGCALGGSTVLISKLKSRYRQLRVYDVFEMIPPPGAQDDDDVHQRYQEISAGRSTGIQGDKYYGYEDDLMGKVRQNLRSFDVDESSSHVHLIKGLLQDTMLIDQPVAFAHIDVDWYEPVFHCLVQIVPNLVVGGIIVLDDYHDWSGCHKAVESYFSDKREGFSFDDSAGALTVTRTA